jgi:tRNA pseudouridine65 synthase
MNFRILYQDEHFVAIDKPAGFHVHPPEDPSHSISNTRNCLFLLRKQLNQYLYPVHRLDRATSGVVLFGLTQFSARNLCALFRNQEIKKTYFCVARGWTAENGEINRSLKSEIEDNSETWSDFENEAKDSLTVFQRIDKIALPYAVGKHSTSRYSLVRVLPQTGRRHQIRRHFHSASHPLIGDSIYGDGKHNRIFRDDLKIPGLLLKAQSLEFSHPHTGQLLKISSRWNGLWHQVFDLFGICPFEKNF